MVHSLKTEQKQTPNTDLFLNSEINVRCVLGAFMMGTGAGDVGKFMSMIGVGGGVAFERQFYLNQLDPVSVVVVVVDTELVAVFVDLIAILPPGPEFSVPPVIDTSSNVDVRL